MLGLGFGDEDSGTAVGQNHAVSTLNYEDGGIYLVIIKSGSAVGLGLRDYCRVLAHEKYGLAWAFRPNLWILYGSG